MFSIAKFCQYAVIGAALTGLLQAPSFASPAYARNYMPNTLTVSVLRQKDHSGEAMLRLSTVVAVTGCAAVQPLRHEVEITNHYLDVVVKGYHIHFSDTPHDTKTCKKGAQYSTADIPLDRKLIEDNGIEQIRLILDRGLGSDYYHVALDKDRLELTPRSQTVFKPGKSPANGQPVLTHWYYPENTVILTAPRPGQPQASLTGDFARANGLVTLESLLPGFTPPAGQNGRYYYVDGSGRIAAKLPDTGTLTVGDGIYAQRPGLYE